MAADLLNLLAAELDMHSLPDQRKSQLQSYLDVAANRIREKGITLDASNSEDVHLQVEYAAWLFRRRRQEASKLMPEYLRTDIHDRLISEKGRVING